MNSARTERLNKFKISCNERSANLKSIANSLQIDIPNIYEIYRNKMYDIDEDFAKYGVDFFNPEDKNADILYDMIDYYLNRLTELSLITIYAYFKDYFSHSLKRRLKPMDNDKMLDKIFGSYIEISDSLQNKSVDKIIEISLILAFDDALKRDYDGTLEAFKSIGREDMITNAYNSHLGKSRTEFINEYLENESKPKMKR